MPAEAELANRAKNQIAEAHGGTLTLENRSDGTGCEALLRLPIG